MYNSIKSKEDIRCFLEKTNELHDGYIIGVRYDNNGISKIENGHYFEPHKTKLVLKILVTSIWDAVVELEFESLLEWQIKDSRLDMLTTTVMFYSDNLILWSDDVYINMEETKKDSYVIAGSMKWRFAKE